MTSLRVARVSPQALAGAGRPRGRRECSRGRRSAGRAAPRRRCPALPRRGAECRGANGGGARQCARQDGPCRPDSKKHNPCSLSPETNTNLECFTAHHYERSGRFTIPPWASPGAPAQTLSPREDPTRPSAESENPRARHRNGTDWPLDILWRVPQRGLQHPEEGPCVGT